MNKRYYKKKGASHKERLRCPLCGTLKSILYFSQDHLFGVYRYRYGGKGDISVTLIQKDSTFMTALNQSIAGRLKELLEHFTGMKYYSELEMAMAIKTSAKPVIATTIVSVAKPKIKPAGSTKIIPFTRPIPVPISARVVPKKVVIN